MKKTFDHKIFDQVKNLPENWDVFSVETIFLSSRYLKVLEDSAPKNMQCFYVAIYEFEILVGIAIAQFLDGNQMESFGDRDKCMKTFFRNVAFKNFSSQILFVGNNMLTGQNAFSFSTSTDASEALKELRTASQLIEQRLKKQGKKVHLTSFKDFTAEQLPLFNTTDFSAFYEFKFNPIWFLIFNRIGFRWKIMLLI